MHARRRHRRYSVSTLALATLLAALSLQSPSGAGTLVFTAADPHFDYDAQDGTDGAFFYSDYFHVGTGPSAINPADLTSNSVTFRFQAPAGKEFVVNPVPGYPDLEVDFDVSTLNLSFTPFTIPNPTITFENLHGGTPSAQPGFFEADSSGNFGLSSSYSLPGATQFTAINATFTFPAAFTLASSKSLSVAMFFIAQDPTRLLDDPGTSWAYLTDLPITQGSAVPLPASSLMGLVLLTPTLFLPRRRRQHRR